MSIRHILTRCDVKQDAAQPQTPKAGVQQEENGGGGRVFRIKQLSYEAYLAAPIFYITQTLSMASNHCIDLSRSLQFGADA